MQNTKKLAVIALIAASAFALTGCGAISQKMRISSTRRNSPRGLRRRTSRSFRTPFTASSTPFTSR